MILTKLTLENVRGLAKKTVDFQEKTAVLGANGAGKSTIIEAIRILSVGKSFRTNRFDELIRFDQPYLRISGERSEGDDKTQALEFFYGLPFAEQATKERVLTVNKKPTDWLSYVGQFPSVLFVPSDTDIITGPPQLRRKYLDGILWQVDPEFRHNYLNFSRVLRERSSVLFLIKINRAGLDELAPWNELISRLTAAIRSKRQAYVEYLKKGLSGQKVGNLTFNVEYSWSKSELAALQTQEIQSAQNLFGAHRDELEILMNDRSARRYSSRGQARSAIVLLKVLESRFLAETTGNEPLILLDDMFSELDETNSRFLFASFSPKSQVVVTAITSQSLIKGWDSVKL